MCGDIDDETGLDEELLARLTAHAGKYGALASDGGAGLAAGFADETARAGYMSGLFRDSLCRALTDATATPQGSHADAIASQAIVFARLAGFLAGHLPPGGDMFRSLVDAMMDGYKEPAEIAGKQHHDHSHRHDH